MHAHHFTSLISGIEGSIKEQGELSLVVGMSSNSSSSSSHNGERKEVAVSEKSKYELKRGSCRDPPGQQLQVERETDLPPQQQRSTPAPRRDFHSPTWHPQHLAALHEAHARARRAEDNLLMARAAALPPGANAYLNLAAGWGQGHHGSAGLHYSPDDEQALRNVLSGGRFLPPANFGGNASQVGGSNLHDLHSAVIAARMMQSQLQNPAAMGLSGGASGSLGGLPSANSLLSLQRQAELSSLRGSNSSLGTLIPSSSVYSASRPVLGHGATLDSQIRMNQFTAMQGSASNNQASQRQVDPYRRFMGHLGTSAVWRHPHGTGTDEGVPTGLNGQNQLGPLKSSENRRGAKSSPPLSPSPRPSKRSRVGDAEDNDQTTPQETTLAVAGTLPPALPSVDVGGQTQHYSQREHASLATDEDHNWLSEFQCFIRREILEIFRATNEDVRVRNNSKHLVTQQVGIRCRFCAHLPPSARASRSSAFPSSVPQIYQSFTMMLRDHWPACQSIPSPQKEQFREYRAKNNQGASDSKNYWAHAARRVGLTNTAQGLQIDDASRAAAARIPPFGHNSETVASLRREQDEAHIPLVMPDDQVLLEDHPMGKYWYFLLSHVQRVRLSSAERVGNRKSLRLGLPGFGCRYCASAERLGLSRIFPARRRTLPTKISDLHDHLRRCTLCPASVKEELLEFEKQQQQQQQVKAGDKETKTAVATPAGEAPCPTGDEEARVSAASSDPTSTTTAAEAKSPAGTEREFFSRIWCRLGHGDRPEPT